MTEIARAEYLVVKPPVADDDEEDDSSEDEQEDEEQEAGVPKSGDDALKDNGNGESATKEGSDAVPEAPTVENTEKQLEASETVQQNADPEEQIAEQTLKTEDGEDVDELTAGKLAWESLEVARSICDKQEQTNEWLEKKADVLIALGECMLVDENFGNALEEFKTALEIQKKIFEPNNRKISETLFQMGLTYRNNDDFESAAASFDKAAEVFKNIIESLQKNSNESDSAVTSEITQLKKILEDIQEHAQDALESAKACKKQIEDQKAVITNVFTQTLKSVVGDEKDEVPVNDISNMIQRKSVKRPATSSDSTITTTTATESTAGEGSSIEAIATECLSTAVEEKAGSEEQSEVKKAKIDE